jgi:amino acid transporter
LTSQTAPLSALANHYGVSWLGDIVVLGAAFSFFGALNAWLNYLARMVFTMGSDRVLPRVFSRAHPRTGSPYVAVVAWAVIWFGVTIYVFASGTNLTHAFGDFGTFSGYCWTLVYLLVALAAPIYFLRKRVPNPTVIVAGLVGAAVMVIEFYYSFNPMPTGALAIYVYIFAAGTIAATIGGIIAYKLAPSWVRRVGQTEEPSRHMDGLAPAVVEQAAAPLVERP